MLTASNLAGKAINISKTTAPHAASCPFTSLFNVPWSCCKFIFEKFLTFNFENFDKSKDLFDLKSRYEILFKLYNVKNISQFADQIKKIKNFQLEDNLNTLNIDVYSNSKKIIDGINILRLKNNPVNLSKDDIFNIFQANKLPL